MKYAVEKLLTFDKLYIDKMSTNDCAACVISLVTTPYAMTYGNQEASNQPFLDANC